MEIDEIPHELEEAMHSAVDEALEANSEISTMVAGANALGWGLEVFEPSEKGKKGEDGKWHFSGTATYRGEHDWDSDRPFMGNCITASVELTARKNSESEEWEVHVEEVSDCEINKP